MPTRAITLLIAIGFASSCLAQPASAPTTRPTSRKEFAAALARVEEHTPGGEREVKEGMSEAEIVKLLGKPDDVRTELDPASWDNIGRGEVVWCYGSNGHMTFPTLGAIYFEKGRSSEVFGATQTVIDPNLIPEEQVRALLRIIDQTPTLNGYRFNSLPFVRVVNALQPLGKEKALGLISEYLRVFCSRCSHEGFEPEGLFLVLRVLFDIPDDPGYMPDMMVGAAHPQEPQDPKTLPRFPLVLIEDIPLMLVSGYALGGAPQPVSEHVDYFRKHGALRSALLHPGDHPLEALRKLEDQPGWPYRQRDKDQIHLMMTEQLLRLVDSVYRLDPDEYDDRIHTWDEETRDLKWADIVKTVDHLQIKWDSKKQLYTFGDGSHLKEVPDVHYKRHIWRPDIPGIKTAVVFERESARYVRLYILQKEGSAEVRVFNTCCGDNYPVAELTTADWRRSAKTIEMKEGCSVRAEITAAGTVLRSPEFAP